MIQFTALYKSHPNAVSISFTFLSTFVFSCVTLFVKLIPSVPTYQIIQTQSIFQFFLMYHSAQNYKFPTYKDSNSITALIILRSFLCFTTVLCWFKGALYVSAAETEIVSNLSVFWSTFYAKLSKRIIATFFMLILGVYCLSISKIDGKNQETSQYHYFGLTLLLLSSLMNSCIELCQKKLSADFNVEVNNIMMTIYVISIFGTSIVQLFSPQDSVHLLNADAYLIIFLISIFDIIGLYCYAVAFSLGEITTISLLQLLTLIYGFLFDIFIFKQQINNYTILGAGFISTGILIKLTVNDEKH